MLSDMSVQGTTALALQTHGSEFADPEFGLPMKRFVKTSMGLTNSNVSEYTDQAMWNSDDTLWRLTGSGIASGFKIVAAINPGATPLHTSDYTTGFSALHYGSGVRWDPKVRTRLWFFHRLIATTASISAGSNIATLADRTGIQGGDTIFIIGAGPYNGQGTTSLDQGMLAAQVTSIGPGAQQVTINQTATFAVTSAECRRSDWLSRYDLDTSTTPYGRTITKVRDFSEYFKISIDSTDPRTFSSASQSWQEFSDDGQWVAIHTIIDGSRHGKAMGNGLTDTNPSTGSVGYQYAPRNHEIINFNPYTLTKRVINVFQSPYALPPSLGGLAHSSFEPYGTCDAVDSVDFCAISPRGTYVMVQNNTNNWLGGRWSKAGGANSYDAFTGSYVGKLSGSLGHGDLIADGSGVEWLIQAHDNDTPFDSSHIGKSRFPEGVVWTPGQEYTQAGINTSATYSSGRLVKMFNYGFFTGGTHTSARNVNNPTFVILEIVNGTNAGPSTSGVDNEIVKVYLDSKVGNGAGGVADAPHFERLCHHRSTATDAADYYGNPFSAPSRSGEHVAFNSRWGNQANPCDLYLIDLAWFNHFSSLKAWRQAYQTTQYTQGRMGSFNGWKSLAYALGTDRTKDGIYAHGFHTKLNGTFGYGPYGNDTWRWDPNLWKWILDLDGDVNTSTGPNSDSNGSARKDIRRVQADVTNGTVISFRNSSGDASTTTQPSWTPGSTLVDIWNYQGTIRRAQNVGISSIAASSVTLSSSVTCLKNDLIYPVGVALGPGPTWHSWGTKPWVGHPYASVRPEPTRNTVLVGSKNSGVPKCDTSHTMRYKPTTRQWEFVSVGYWQDDQSTGQLVHCMDGLGSRTTEWVPDYEKGECMEYIPSTDEILRFGGGIWPLAGTFYPDHTWIYSIGAGTWTRYSSTNGVTNPGYRYGSVCQYDSVRDRVWVMGGDNGAGPAPFTSAWYWNPAAHTWTQVSLNGPYPAAREEVSFAYDPNADKIMIAFGNNTGNNTGWYQDAWLLDLQSLTWENLGTVPMQYNPGKAAGPLPIGCNVLSYLPSPYNCFALLDVRNGMGPGANAQNGDAFYDPHFVFMRLVELNAPVAPQYFVRSRLF